MEDGQCSKSFPKQYQMESQQNVNGYLLYRWKGITADVRWTTLDKCVVPYNAYLLKKYNAHINVVVCTSMQAIKDIYKYIYKGFD